jgi:hypothetical protein
MHVPSCNYQQQEIKKHELGVASNGIRLITSFIKTHPAVLKLKHMDSPICEISDSRGGEYEDEHLLGCYAMQYHRN